MGAEFCFNVYDGKRALMVAAASQNDKVQWMEDITETVQVLSIYLMVAAASQNYKVQWMEDITETVQVLSIYLMVAAASQNDLSIHFVLILIIFGD